MATTTIPLSSRLTGFTATVDSVAFSRDERTLVAGGEDGALWLWNLADPARPARLGPLTGHTGDVVAFGRDGILAAAPTGPGCGTWPATFTSSAAN
jgi:WD40 repeat protein